MTCCAMPANRSRRDHRPVVSIAEPGSLFPIAMVTWAYLRKFALGDPASFSGPDRPRT